MTGTFQDTLVAATLRIGEREVPPGSNICSITRRLDSLYPPVPLWGGGTSTRGRTSWCSSAVLDAIDEGGNSAVDRQRGCLVINGVTIWCFYTPSDVQAYQAAKAWLGPNERPPLGAQIFYRWDGSKMLSDHTGLVIGVTPDGTLQTWEGNTSPFGTQSDGGEVCTFGPGMKAAARPRRNIVGYGVVPYVNSAPVPPAPPTERKRMQELIQKIGDQEIWLTDGVNMTRRHVPDPQTLKDLVYDRAASGNPIMFSPAVDDQFKLYLDLGDGVVANVRQVGNLAPFGTPIT